MSCDVGEVTERLENDLCSSVSSSTSQLIFQPFRCFTYVTAHYSTLLSLLLRHRLFTWRAAHDPVASMITTSHRGRLMATGPTISPFYVQWRHAVTSSGMTINERILKLPLNDFLSILKLANRRSCPEN